MRNGRTTRMLTDAIARARSGADVWVVAASRSHAEILWARAREIDPSVGINLRIVPPTYGGLDPAGNPMGFGPCLWDHWAAESQASQLEREIEALRAAISRKERSRAGFLARAAKYDRDPAEGDEE